MSPLRPQKASNPLPDHLYASCKICSLWIFSLLKNSSRQPTERGRTDDGGHCPCGERLYGATAALTATTLSTEQGAWPALAQKRRSGRTVMFCRANVST